MSTLLEAELLHLLTYTNRYVAKYATKAEEQAPDLPNMLSSLVANLDSGTSGRTTRQKMLNKMLSERAYSAQETAHLLTGIPLVRSSVSFSHLNLATEGSMREITLDVSNADADTGGPVDGARQVTSDSWIQRSVKSRIST